MTATADAHERGRLEHARMWRGARPRRHASPRRAYEQLRSSLRVGVVGPGETLGELWLGEALGASRNSVRAALQMLAQEGLVVRRTKTGTRPDRRIVDIPLGEVLPRDFADRDKYPQILVQQLRHRVVPPPDGVRKLLGTSTEPVLTVEQLSTWDGEPLYLRTGYVPLREAPEDFLGRQADLHAELRSFADSFRYLFGRDPGRRESAIRAVPAQGAVAHRLGLAPGRPVLLRELVMHDVEGAVREVSRTHFRGDRVALSGHD